MDDSRRTPAALDISVVVPVMNEAESVETLAAEIARAMDGAGLAWECVWVDDGSTDATAAVLRRVGEADGRHRLVRHERNYGQSAALATGFRHARAEIIGTLDGDGQNDPASLPELHRLLVAEGADMVNGWRERRNDSLARKLCSRIANGFRNSLTRERVRDVGCSTRVFRRVCVERLPVFKGMHRFLPTLVRMAGHGKILETPVNHRPRERGATKYGIGNRLWVGIWDTLAVRWMLSRMVYPRVRAEEGDGGPARVADAQGAASARQ